MLSKNESSSNNDRVGIIVLIVVVCNQRVDDEVQI